MTASGQNTTCAICGSVGEGKALTARALPAADRFAYRECPQCLSLQIEETPADLARYYADGYYSFQHLEPQTLRARARVRFKGWRDGLLVAQPRGLGSKFLQSFAPTELALKLALQSLAKVPGITKNSRILDIGCGAGLLLYTLSKGGFRNCLGIDPFLPATITYSSGLTIKKASPDAIKETFDIVMLHHSLEHTATPVDTLKEVRRILAPKGRCIVRVPTVSSWTYAHYHDYWVQFDPPRHLVHFSRTGLALAAERAGLRVVEHYDDSSEFQFWGSEQLKQGIALHSPTSFGVNRGASIFSTRDIEEFARRAAELNADHAGDQVVYYLEAAT